MPLIRLRKASEPGEETGVLFVNPDQILTVAAGQHATEIQLSDGRTRWVKETPDEVAAAINAAPRP